MNIAKNAMAVAWAFICFGVLGVSVGDMIMKYVVGQPPFDPATMDRCAQAEAASQAVAERMGIYVTIPPWQAMVLTPILDPR